MKPMHTWRWVPAALLLAFGGTTAGRAEGLAIQSFDGTGKLTFNEVSTAETYRVEWAPSPNGPWTNFTGSAGAALDLIVAQGSGIVTCTVPMCYRVVATVADETQPSAMVAIQAGTNSGTDPDFGAYSLTVEAFSMDATEVTKAQWDTVYAWAIANGYGFDHAGAGKASDHPVQTVSWYDCVKWCNARSQKDDRTPCYTVGGNVYKTGQSAPDCNFSANGYRLPTATEWMYAARGGLSGKRFPWGDTINHTQANYKANPSSYDSGYAGYDTRYSTGDQPYTSPAGAFPANGYGLFDMAGNITEWCNDSPYTSPRYLKGGSWAEDASLARCGHNTWTTMNVASSSYGFRAVCR